MTGEPTLVPEQSDACVAEAPDQPSEAQNHDPGDIGVQRTPVKMSGAGYDVVVDVDEEVSFDVYSIS